QGIEIGVLRGDDSIEVAGPDLRRRVAPRRRQQDDDRRRESHRPARPHLQYWIRLTTSAPDRRPRPSRNVSSTRKPDPTTTPCRRRTRRWAAEAVPPVARRSSTTSTFSPGRTESR